MKTQKIKNKPEMTNEKAMLVPDNSFTINMVWSNQYTIWMTTAQIKTIILAFF
jgi:hypothetical protein